MNCVRVVFPQSTHFWTLDSWLCFLWSEPGVRCTVQSWFHDFSFPFFPFLSFLVFLRVLIFLGCKAMNWRIQCNANETKKWWIGWIRILIRSSPIHMKRMTRITYTHETPPKPTKPSKYRVSGILAVYNSNYVCVCVYDWLSWINWSMDRR
jgi:hypothetical protein